jgi:hypothetical protein
MVKALLLDIVSQFCFPRLVSTPERIKTLLFTADDKLRSRDYLMEAVRVLSNDRDERTYVILDGLDQHVPEIIKIISYLLESSPKLSIMVSGRDCGFKHTQMFGQAWARNVSTIILNDIRVPILGDYILHHLRGLQFSETEKIIIQQRVLNCAEG